MGTVPLLASAKPAPKLRAPGDSAAGKCVGHLSARALRRDCEGGQATVEAALVLPLVATLLLAVVQVGLVVRAQVLVTHAAREGARAAAVDPDPVAAARAAKLATTLDPTRMTVSSQGRTGPGSRVAVRVTYALPTDVLIVGGLIGDLTLHAEATMRVE